MEHQINITNLKKGLLEFKKVLSIRSWGAFCLNNLSAEQKNYSEGNTKLQER